MKDLPGEESPVYAANLGAFLGSLVMMCLSDPGADYCRAVREKDVLVNEFTITLYDEPCKAETEVLVTVVIRVEDKVPPTIYRPPQSLSVECNRVGNGRPSL